MVSFLEQPEYKQIWVRAILSKIQTFMHVFYDINQRIEEFQI